MTDKSLSNKAINIKGKKYVQVKDRILYFNEKYPNGCIKTELLSDTLKVVVQATVIPDIDKPERYFTGISASNPNKTVEKQVPHEVSETSAVGRALAMMGIGVIDGVASVDEMAKAKVYVNPKYPKVGRGGEISQYKEKPLATEKQKNAIRKLVIATKADTKQIKEEWGDINELNISTASNLIKTLSEKLDK